MSRRWIGLVIGATVVVVGSGALWRGRVGGPAAGPVLWYPFGEDGQPVMIRQGERLGLPEGFRLEEE